MSTVKPGAKEVVLVASGDSRISANQRCWPAQQTLEKAVDKAFGELGARITRGHPYDPDKKHGFIDGQARGIQIFRKIDPEAPLVVAEAVWEYTSHVLAGLTKHRGPILTLANWSGEWPGLVGMLNVNASLTKAGIPYSSIWSEDFEDGFARGALRQWLSEGRDRARHEPRAGDRGPDVQRQPTPRTGRAVSALGEALRRDQAILGVFDEGCMGMYNAIIPDDLMHAMGLFKERLSQSMLYAAMREVPDDTARRHYDWLTARGMKFALGRDEATELTEGQVLEGPQDVRRRRPDGARLRLRRDRDPVPAGTQGHRASPRTSRRGSSTTRTVRPCAGPAGALFDGLAVPHFNEVDECAGVDALLTNRVWTDLGIDPSTTLHDVRWGARGRGERRERLRLGLRDLGRGPGLALHRRVRRARGASASRRCTSRRAARR